MNMSQSRILCQGKDKAEDMEYRFPGKWKAE